MSELTETLPVVALRGMTILPDMVIHFDVSRERSVKAIEEAMLNHLTKTRDSYLLRAGQKPDQLYRIHVQNVASARQEQAQSIASLLPIVLIFVLFGTGSVTALDAIAGERDHGLPGAQDRR